MRQGTGDGQGEPPPLRIRQVFCYNIRVREYPNRNGKEGLSVKKQWWKSAVVYQIYPQSFLDTNGDGVGDIRGIIEKIPYIRDLGANVIWLCPIYASPMADQGYDISDYRHVDPLYGTDEDLEELIGTAKENGIRVLMDLVVNHCSDRHPWFREAVSDPESPYADYFIIRETQDGAPPNNVRSYFGAGTWTRIGDSDRYYFHCFAPQQPDLNWENPALRKEITDIIEYWLAKGIAGFRVDAIGNLKKSPELFTSRHLPADGDDGLVSVVRYTLLQDGIGDFLEEMRRVFAKWDAFTVSELAVPPEKLEEYVGGEGYFSTTFDFTYADMDVEWVKGKAVRREITPRAFAEAIASSQLAIQEKSWGAPFLENHDQPRSVNKFIPAQYIGYESKTALGAAFFFLRGTPFIYQGQEIGMENYPYSSVSQFRDVAALGQIENAADAAEREELFAYHKARGRDNARTPMQWENAENAGFSSAEPWIPVNPDYVSINVMDETKDPRSVLNFYREMIRLRRASEWSDALVWGRFEPIPGEGEKDGRIAYVRRTEEQTVYVAVNLSEKPVPLPAGMTGEVILDNLALGREEGYAGLPERLAPFQVVLAGVKTPR